MNKINIWDELERKFYIRGSDYQKAMSKGEKIPQFSLEILKILIKKGGEFNNK